MSWQRNPYCPPDLICSPDTLPRLRAYLLVLDATRPAFLRNQQGDNTYSTSVGPNTLRHSVYPSALIRHYFILTSLSIHLGNFSSHLSILGINASLQRDSICWGGDRFVWLTASGFMCKRLRWVINCPRVTGVVLLSSFSTFPPRCGLD